VCHRTGIEGIECCHTIGIKENYCKFCKLAFISAFEVFTLNRNSLNHDVISLPVTVTNCYTKELSK